MIFVSKMLFLFLSRPYRLFFLVRAKGVVHVKRCILHGGYALPQQCSNDTRVDLLNHAPCPGLSGAPKMRFYIYTKYIYMPSATTAFRFRRSGTGQINAGVHGRAFAQSLGGGELLRFQQDPQETRPLDRFHHEGKGKVIILYRIRDAEDGCVVDRSP